MAKPPLVKENTVRLPKCKSPEVQGALEPTKDTKKTINCYQADHSQDYNSKRGPERLEARGAGQDHSFVKSAHQK